ARWWVERGVVTVDPVDGGALEQTLGVQLAGAQGGSGVGGDERVARPAGEDDDASLLEVPHATATNVRLGDGFHADGGLQARLAAETFERLLQGKAIEDGCQHAHVVGGGLLDDLAGAGDLGAAQDVAASHDDGLLYTALADLLDLASDVEGLVDADPRLAGIAEALPAELENNAAILRRLRGSGLLVHDMFLCGPRNHFPGL